jgi:hypothetical protein
MSGADLFRNYRGEVSVITEKSWLARLVGLAGSGYQMVGERLVCMRVYLRMLMRAHAASGNVGTALRAYERCRATLRDQLGALPSPSTRAAHSQLLT